MELPSHGANAYTLYRNLQIPMPDKIYDLSENVNVLGCPKSVKELWPKLIGEIANYPNELADPFRATVANFHHVPSENVVVGNGAAELLMAIATIFREKNALLIEPTFSEYARTLSQQNVKVKKLMVTDICKYSLPLDIIIQKMNEVDVIYICNPNNPTGVLTDKQIIEQLLQVGKKVGCSVVIDEAFMDWTDELQSVISLVSKYDNLFVLRSMTKMYGLAGIRLGYCISQQAQKIKQFLPHWNVSQIAIEIGCQVLREKQFVEQSKKVSNQTRKAMKQFLLSKDCQVTNSVTNFITFRPPNKWDTKDFFYTFLKAGIVLRHTYNFMGLDGKWFRIGMKDNEAMEYFKKRFEQYADNFSSSSRRNTME